MRRVVGCEEKLLMISVKLLESAVSKRWVSSARGGIHRCGIARDQRFGSINVSDKDI